MGVAQNYTEGAKRRFWSMFPLARATHFGTVFLNSPKPHSNKKWLQPKIKNTKYHLTINHFGISADGCGSKLNRRGKPQVLVHVSTCQGNPFWHKRKEAPSHKSFGNFCKWVWLKIKPEGQTAGFGPCFHLPGRPILAQKTNHLAINHVGMSANGCGSKNQSGGANRRFWSVFPLARATDFGTKERKHLAINHLGMSAKGCGSKLHRRGKPQVLVHVSTCQGNRFWHKRKEAPSHKSFGNVCKRVWLKITQKGQTAGFGPCFHLPGQPILAQKEEAPSHKSFGNVCKWVWLKKIKQEGQTAGFGLCFHLPGQPILAQKKGST